MAVAGTGLGSFDAALAAGRVEQQRIGRSRVRATRTPARRGGPRPVRVIEATDMAAMMRRMIRAHARRLTGCDLEDLAEFIALADLHAEAVQHVVSAHRQLHGTSWADIGRAAGIERSSACERWGHGKT